MGSKLCYDQNIRQSLQSNKKTTTDEFILKYNTLNENLIDNVLFDQRRIVFVSFIGLFKTWRNCPSLVLYTSLFILPLKEKWIYEPTKYQQEIQANCPGKYALFYQDTEFVELLKWKNSQGLVFWTINDFQNIQENVENNSICPFWNDFNAKLKTLYDPITGDKYKVIPFKASWWQNIYNKNHEHMSRFDIAVPLILKTLDSIKKSNKFKAIQEILYQSNPFSLNPVISYNDFEWKHNLPRAHCRLKTVSSEQLCALDENFFTLEQCVEFEKEEFESGNWCIVDNDSLCNNDDSDAYDDI